MFSSGALMRSNWDTEEFDGCEFNNGKLSISPPKISVIVNNVENSYVAFPSATDCYIVDNDLNIKPCIIEYSRNMGENSEDYVYIFNLYDEGDSINELYNGSLGDGKFMLFAVYFYYGGPNEFLGDEELPSTYSLRQTETTTSFLEKVRQIFQERKQQNLDNPTE